MIYLDTLSYDFTIYVYKVCYNIIVIVPIVSIVTIVTIRSDKFRK